MNTRCETEPSEGSVERRMPGSPLIRKNQMKFGEPKIGSASKFKEARVLTDPSDDEATESQISKSELLDEAKAKIE